MAGCTRLQTCTNSKRSTAAADRAPAGHIANGTPGHRGRQFRSVRLWANVSLREVVAREGRQQSTHFSSTLNTDPQPPGGQKCSGFYESWVTEIQWTF